MIDDPAEIEDARRLAAARAIAPLSPEALADLWMPSVYVLPKDLPEDEIALKLSKVSEDKTAPIRARCNSAVLLAFLDPKAGQRAILQRLRQPNEDEQREMLSALQFTAQVIGVNDAELISELRTLIEHPRLGANAIWAARSLQLPDLESVLWRSLDSAEGERLTQALAWLARAVPSRRVFEACCAAWPRLSGRQRDVCLRSIAALYKTEDTTLTNEATEFVATELLALHPIGLGDWPQGECADLLNHGNGPKTRELAQAIEARCADQYLRERAYVAQRRWEGPGSRERILRDLTQPASSGPARRAIHELYGGTADPAVVARVAELIARQSMPHEVKELASLLIAVGGEDALGHVRSACGGLPADMRNDLLQEMDQRSPLEIIRQLATAGVIQVEDPAEFLANIYARRAEDRFDAGDSIGVWGILSAAEIYHAFDVETGTLPVRHDLLLEELGAMSGGAFRPECSHEKMLKSNDEDWDAPYVVQFVHQGRLYRFTARNFGDWYDVERVVAASNRALADAGSSRRFHSAAGGGQVAMLVCVPPEKAAWLGEHFYINWEGELSAPMEEGKAYERHVLEQLNKGE